MPPGAIGVRIAASMAKRKCGWRKHWQYAYDVTYVGNSSVTCAASCPTGLCQSATSNLKFKQSSSRHCSLHHLQVSKIRRFHVWNLIINMPAASLVQVVAAGGDAEVFEISYLLATQEPITNIPYDDGIWAESCPSRPVSCSSQ